VTALWCGLEGVFGLGNTDVSRQIPTVARRFAKTDKDFGSLMSIIEEKKSVISVCSSDALRVTLPVLFSELQAISAALEGYLEAKRASFPRFYFLSHAALLHILAQGASPALVQPYFKRIFAGVSSAEFETRRDGVYISALLSGDARSNGRGYLPSERLSLHKPIKSMGSVEGWMSELLREMQASVQAQCLSAAEEVACLSGPGIAASSLSGRMRAALQDRGVQSAEVLLRLFWTSSMNTAIAATARGEKHALRSALKLATDLLSELGEWARTTAAASLIEDTGSSDVGERGSISSRRFTSVAVRIKQEALLMLQVSISADSICWSVRLAHMSSKIIY
jgi:dynein heavy chain